jgi:hypothetical protein
MDRILGITIPVVAETFDRMSHPVGLPIALTEEDLFRAIDDMNDGPVREGNTGSVWIVSPSMTLILYWHDLKFMGCDA